MHPALIEIAEATHGTPFEDDLFLVGGAVRDGLLGVPHEADFDLVTQKPLADLIPLLEVLSEIPPVVYERFGTAMLRIAGAQIELVTARRESYSEDSRKPTVAAATLEEDAQRRDFTVNTLLQRVGSTEVLDPLGCGLSDLEARVLRTPLDPIETFRDDPLRMLRAIRFKNKLGFAADPAMLEAIRQERGRLRIVSAERIRDEFVKMLKHPSAPEALNDLLRFGLLEEFAPEFLPMVGCTQGSYHHLDVWDHTVLVVRNAGSDDLMLTLGALFHDIGKPPTRLVDENGNIRFFGHESVGAVMTRRVMARLKFSNREIETVALLVQNHMRLGSSPTFTPSAARRLLRDLGDETPRLLELVEADANGLRPGVRGLDLSSVRAQLEAAQKQTPVDTLVSPLSGEEIMSLLHLPAGPEVGRLKRALTEKVLDGDLATGDKAAAEAVLLEEASGFQIQPARSFEDMDVARTLFRAYADSLGIDLAYQGFDEELAGLPGKFAPPDGELLIAFRRGEPVGCVALRPLADGVCEMKRLYVSPSARGLGLGRALADAIIAEAKRIGYREMRLDTLDTMASALALYRSAGFVEIPAYYETPVSNTVFMALAFASEG